MTGGKSFLCVAVAASALSMSACSGDPPTPQPTSTTSAVPTSVASVPAPPAHPSSEKTPAGAVAFVRYFWETYNYAHSTGNTAPLQDISEAGCKYCAAAVKDTSSLWKAGTRIQGYRISVTEAASPPVKITTGTAVVATVRQAPGKAVYTDGQSTVLKGMPDTRFTFALAWKQGVWSVEGVDYKPVSS